VPYGKTNSLPPVVKVIVSALAPQTVIAAQSEEDED
jgi:hypothetical protein